LEQQTTFIRSYVNHRPQFNPKASATPKMNAMDGLAKGSISEFLLDSRTPGGSSTDLQSNWYNYAEDEARREKDTERQVQELLKEVRIWRVANSAQWVAWGIVQAKVPELDGPTPMIDGAEIAEEPASISAKENANANGEVNGVHDEVEKRPEGLKAEALLSGDNPKEAEALEEDEDEFDYLAYAQDRALFFWGDVVGLGIVQKEELPKELIGRLKIVDH
jgi:choline kinase